mgnify:CR=1 FL=1
MSKITDKVMWELSIIVLSTGEIERRFLVTDEMTFGTLFDYAEKIYEGEKVKVDVLSSKNIDYLPK